MAVMKFKVIFLVSPCPWKTLPGALSRRSWPHVELSDFYDRRKLMCALYNEAPIQKVFVLNSTQYFWYFACDHPSIHAAALARSAVEMVRESGSARFCFRNLVLFPAHI